MPAARQRASDMALREIRAPRLVASEPRIDMPLILLPAVPDHPAVSASQGTAAPSQVPDEAAPAPVVSAYDRIAALAAVPMGGSPGRAEARAVPIGAVELWRRRALDFGAAYWRQIGLGGAIALATGLLLWRLRERGRHTEQELFLALEEPAQPVAAPEPDAAPEFVERAVTAEWQMACDDDSRLNELLRRAASAAEPQQPAPPALRHRTLREAVDAMKAELEREPFAGRPVVDA